jgi:TrmH family RNA methyltransferase
MFHVEHFPQTSHRKRLSRPICPKPRTTLHAQYNPNMLSSAARANLSVVLVGARNPSNIGAAARAMQDFGFSDLRIVNDFAAPFEAAQLEAPQIGTLQFETPKSAVGASSVMHNAHRFNTLPEAIADCSLILGTTAIGNRELNREILTLQQAAPDILQALESKPLNEPPPRTALLFGSEKTGLTNDQLSHCSTLLTIPLFAPEAARHLSMNLGQSVAVCLYELSREGFENSREIPTLHPAAPSSEDRERLTQLLLDLMQSTGYARRFPANSRETVVRRLVQQLGSTRDEVSTWMGLFRHLQRTNPEK